MVELISSAQALVTTEYYLPLFFQSAKEASPSRSGLLIIPITFTQALMGVFTGITIHRTGRYLELLWAGVALLTIGTGLYIHLSPASSLASIVGFELIAGIGAGLLFSPPLIALQAMVTQTRTSTATATLGFVRNLATVVAVVIGGIVFQNGIEHQLPALRRAGVPANVTAMLAGDSAMANVMVIATISDAAQRLAVKQAFAESLRMLWIMCSCVCACGVVASGFIAKRALSREHLETKTGLRNELDGDR
jgi:MFS family permease